MKVFVTTENYMYRCNDKLYISNSFKRIIERYNRYFGQVVLCTRVADRAFENIPTSFEDATDIISDYLGIDSLQAFLKQKYNSEIKRSILDSDLVIARVPSIISYKAASYARRLKVPYMVEVVGCAWDGYWNYNIVGKIAAPIVYTLMKQTVKNANYATYVTEKFLQERYPCKCESIHCSNVFIEKCDDEVLQKRINRITSERKNKLVLMTAAAVDVSYKGQEYVIEAIPGLNIAGYEVEYKLAGAGDKTRLLKIAEKLGVENKIIFLGALSHNCVLEEEDSTDIYIQPSLQEGLPRSVIEAMSRGCPVLGARTAGIPELIDPECVFKPASGKAIEQAIIKIIGSDLSTYARNNFKKSKEYESSILEIRREKYYKRIKEDLSILGR